MPARKVALSHVLEAWQLGQERRSSAAPGGALVASKWLLLPSGGVLSYDSEECLQETGRTLPRASTSPDASEPQLGCPLPVSLGPGPTGYAPFLFSLFVQSQLLAHPPPGQGLKEALQSWEPAPKWECSQLDLKDIWGQVSRDASSHSLDSEVDFLSAVLYLCGEMCHLPPTQFTLFSCFVKNKK